MPKSDNTTLGRGLDHLLNELLDHEPTQPTTLLHVVPETIQANPYQPRQQFSAQALEELASSIATHGMLQPLVVRKSREGQGYELVAGERRLRASRKLGLGTVPVIVAEVSDDKLLELALVENIQRQALDPIEEAQAYKRLMERCDYTQEQMASRVGRSRSSIANALRLLELPGEVHGLIASRKLSAGHARALAGLPDPNAQLELAHETMREGWSVRALETAVQAHKGRTTTKRERSSRPSYLEQLEGELQRRLGLRVRIVSRQRQKGRLMIEFNSDDEFEQLLERFS